MLLNSGGSGFNTQLAIALTENTGGVYRAIRAPTAIGDAMAEVQSEMTAHYDEMSSRYRIVYERPTDEPGEEIAAGVARQGVTMQLFGDRRRAEQ